MVREMSMRHRVSVLTTHASGAGAAELRVQLPACEQLTSILHAPAKRTSAGFATSVARSWLSPLPADLWRWRVPALREAAGAALAQGEFDICVADFLSAMPNLPHDCRVPLLLFEHNVEHVIWKRLSRSVAAWQRPAVELEWRKVRRYEARAANDVSITVAVSEPDRALLAAIAPHARVRAIPTGVDTDYFALDAEREKAMSVAFVGSMDWYPNEDAALHLIDAILPLIRADVPDVQVTVVGRDPSARLRSAASGAGVQVTGTVADVRPHVARAQVLVVPMRIGGGTRLKIFEALAMGKAVVSSTVGAEGLPVLSGRHLLIADDPGAFAREVVGLLRDPTQRRELGAAGRSLVRDHYSWRQVSRAFEAHCLDALDGNVLEQRAGDR